MPWCAQHFPSSTISGVFLKEAAYATLRVLACLPVCGMISSVSSRFMDKRLLSWIIALPTLYQIPDSIPAFEGMKHSPPNLSDSSTAHGNHTTSQSSSTTRLNSEQRSYDSVKVLVVAGPSGVGKGTILRKLLEKYPSGMGYCVSHTSRKPREGELEGVHYYFVNRPNFIRAIEANEFVEHAEFADNFYGTSLKELERVQNSGKICILEIDLNGVKQVMASALGDNAKYVFISPPSIETLERRLRGRRSEPEDIIQKRVNVAIAEINQANDMNFDLHLVNDDFEKAYNIFKCWLLQNFPEIV